MNCLISVVIPCYNAAPYIAETLRSVEAQRAETEIIVVDDGSTDHSMQIVKACSKKARLLQTPHIGPSGARNAGTAAAVGGFIQYLDADDLLVEGKMAAQMEALERSGADIAYGDWQKLEQQPNGSFAAGERVSRDLGEDAALSLMRRFWCPPAAYLFKRSIIERSGGWDERYPVVEDARFIMTCALRGATFVRVPRLVAYYRVHDASLSRLKESRLFLRHCLKHAEDVEKEWRAVGLLTGERRSALVAAIEHVARDSFDSDPETFETAYAHLLRIVPGYRPSKPFHFVVACRLLGYRNAERLACHFRRLKKMVHP